MKRAAGGFAVGFGRFLLKMRGMRPAVYIHRVILLQLCRGNMGKSSFPFVTMSCAGFAADVLHPRIAPMYICAGASGSAPEGGFCLRRLVLLLEIGCGEVTGGLAGGQVVRRGNR